jgi:hypothetical protein
MILQQQQQQHQQQQQQAANNKPPTIMNHHPSQLPSHLNPQSNHLNPTALLNQTLNNTNALGGHQHQHQHQGLPMQLPPPAGIYDLHPSMNMNGLNTNMQKVPSAAEYAVYMGQQQQQHAAALQQAQQPQHLTQNQYLPRNNINVNVSISFFIILS